VELHAPAHRLLVLSFPTRQFELGWKQITNYKLLLPGKTTCSQNITVNGILWYRPWGDLFPLMLWVGLHIATPSVPRYKYRVFSRNVTAAMLVSLDEKMVSPTNPLWNELYSYSNVLITWVKTLHTVLTIQLPTIPVQCLQRNETLKNTLHTKET